jgi:DNA (cytosine-5)-methyltransferase 3A
MKVLSLFDGMACGMLAMQGAGVVVDHYVAYEIDKYAIQTSTHNFPQIEHRGDVFVADFTEFRDFDFLIGGSPCTYWSIAQKNNRETEARGAGWDLFQQYNRALLEARPSYFIYENNKSMSKAIRESISSTFGFEPVEINSALVSAQNRQRLYWVGKRNADGIYDRVNVEQPEDRGLVLRDILTPGHGESTYPLANCYPRTPGPFRIPEYSISDKARPLNANYPNNCGGWWHRVFSDNPSKQQVDLVVEPIRVGDIGSNAQAHRVYSCEGKSVTINAGGGGQGGKTGLYFCPAEPQHRGPIYRVKDGLIDINGVWYPIKLADGYYVIRKLTVTECKRLQTVPDTYMFPVSNAQAYKLLGNGWTVAVITHLILSAITEEEDAWML